MADLISRVTRARIIQAIAGPRKRWRGQRRGAVIEFWKPPQQTIYGPRINYRARFNFKNFRGDAGTVFDAIAAVERIIGIEKGKKEA